MSDHALVASPVTGVRRSSVIVIPRQPRLAVVWFSAGAGAQLFRVGIRGSAVRVAVDSTEWSCRAAAGCLGTGGAGSTGRRRYIARTLSEEPKKGSRSLGLRLIPTGHLCEPPRKHSFPLGLFHGSSLGRLLIWLVSRVSFGGRLRRQWGTRPETASILGSSLAPTTATMWKMRWLATGCQWVQRTQRTPTVGATWEQPERPTVQHRRDVRS